MSGLSVAGVISVIDKIASELTSGKTFGKLYTTVNAWTTRDGYPLPVVGSLSIALAPCIVIPHAEADKGGAILVHQRLGEFEDQRISRINENIDLSAQYEILLCIVLIDTVDQRPAEKGVASIERRPEAIINGIADVPFNSR